ncbi:putative chromatin remodeling complex subunit [Talaromyces proteolyticus]|uniref:Chromatin remodeling complex subunit n=1 Tax=Talaromyces proteolyticus TaxID=1131652 RepID=A0AAD4KZX5_9EURO|nr:putative chromatin remodeling complex subunit [Talaromyces proteolyticus]KAH8705003.1 putative chromatin remodeling complex subunit [Talaromyces proteolyticus]
MASTRSSLREGLRQAPKVNQPFIPDTAPVRQTRSGGQGPNSLQGTPTGQTPNSHSAGPDISNPSSALFNIDHFEGKDTRQVPMSTREVATPGNKPEVFAKRTRELKAPDFYDPYYPLRFLNLPNPTNIYKRVHYGLQSGIPNEVDFALFHLVNMSHQRGDKLRFEGFPQMMETLMEKALDITWLCTGVKWEFLRDHYKWPEQMHRPNVLNTLWGTNDILDRIKKIPVTLPRDTLVTYEYADELRLIKQAMLALRNMCTLPENAKFIANYSKGLLRDFLVVMFNLPYENRFNELTNDALDIAADVTKFLPTAPDDPLCISLFRFIGDEDRAHVTRGLFALTAFSKEIEEGPKDHLAMLNVDKKHLTRLLHYTLLEGDLDILELAMDFWYQFTCIPENVEYLANLVNMPIMFVKRMVVLLTFQAVKEDQETVHQEEKRAPPPSTIPKVPPELLKELMELSEPERSSKWLRCCFIEDADCEITQIALWQAYQARFVNPNENGSGVLPAAEFIKNVSTTFTNAQAQVVPVQTAGGQTTKFIIKGIRPLETALTFDGWPYLYCRWAVGNPPNQYCDRAFTLPEDLRKHVFEDHMALQPRSPPGCYVLKKADKPIHQCKWEDCTECRRPSDDTSLVAEHVGASHLPLPRKPNAKPPNLARKILQPRIVRRSSFYNTPVTSEGEPYGVAYKACLILRNIAKFACFITSRDTLFNKWDHNKTLRGPLTELLLLLDECLPTLPKRHA